MKALPLLSLLMLGLMTPAVAADATTAARLYTEICAACHGGDRLGAIGPALLPQNLGRMKKTEAKSVILHGRPATQMAGFHDQIPEDEIDALVDYIFQPPAVPPQWGMEQIRASYHRPIDPATLPAAPTHHSDPMNLFAVVESGDHHVSILDGDSFTVIDRFPSHFALHGGIKYSPDGRFAYMASRDGWVSLYDMYSLRLIAEVRAGINTRNIAISNDGQWVAVGNVVPSNVTFLRASDLSPHSVLPVADDNGKESRVSAVYTAPPRQSFIVALRDIPEVWEIPYGKGDLTTPRRIVLDDYLDDFFFDQGYQHLMGAARNGKNGQVVNLDQGRKVADIPLSGMPHLGSGITFDWQGKRVMASPNLKENKISVIDMDTWDLIKDLPTLGPGFFMRSHEQAPYAFAEVFFGPNKDVMQVIDKEKLEIVKNLRPEPGKTVAHAEFTKDGKYVLLSVMEDDGALLVMDARSLEIIKRLPMRRPVGKYNVANKIRYEEGTSH